MVLVVKNTPASVGHVRDVGSVLRQEDPLEEGMATHSSILAWRMLWTEEPGGLQSIRLQRTGLKQLCAHVYHNYFLKGAYNPLNFHLITVFDNEFYICLLCHLNTKSLVFAICHCF